MFRSTTATPGSWWARGGGTAILTPEGTWPRTNGKTARRTAPIAFPLGGRWAGAAGSDEGAILYETWRENQRCAIVPLVRRDMFYRSDGYEIAPSSDPASPAHLPPKGKAKSTTAAREQS